MSAIDTAREMLARTRSISACIDSMAQPYQHVIELRGELSGEPFTELDHTREVLSAELTSIQDLLGKGQVNEACSALAVYEGRVNLMMPLLRQLAGMRRGMRIMGAEAIELIDVEIKILDNDLIGVESILRSFKPRENTSPAPIRDVDNDAGERICVLCGRRARGDLELCPYCGWDPEAPAAECPQCGSTVLRSFRACPSCGKRLADGADEGRTILSPITG